MQKQNSNSQGVTPKTHWSRQRAGALPPCLAMDGKMVRETIGTLTIADASTGVVVATAVQRTKKGGGELKGAQRTLTEMGDLQGRNRIPRAS